MPENENENVETNEEVVETEEVEDQDDVTPDDIEAMRKALKKANHEAASYRHEVKELREKVESDQEKAVREAREEAAAEVAGKYKNLLVTTAAKGALSEAGLTGKSDKLIKLIDFDAVEVTDDGEIKGLDSQVKALKKELPELFDKTKNAPPIDAGDKKPAEKKLSSAERLAASVRGE